MSSLTDFAENQLVDFEHRGQVPTLNANDEFELYTAAPGETGGGTLATYGSYASQLVARSLANFAGTQGAGTTVASSGSSGQTSNNNPIVFPAPTSGPQTLTHLGRRNGGNLRQYMPLTAARTVNAGDASPTIAAGAFTSTWA
jgi:hypothetical protein